MSKYIEFVAKIVRSKSKRKTRKRGGGDITICDLTPMTEGVTVDQLKTKIKSPELLDNLTLVTSEKPMSGAFNIARSVKCSSRSTSEEIICRVWKNAFYVNSDSIKCVRTYHGCVEDSLESFAKELTISIFHSNCGNTLPIYDIQAISINNPLLSFLSEDQKIRIFGQNNNCLCLCVIMKKGEPYKITRANFHKTMELFGNIAEEHLCVDIKPDNLLSNKGQVVMIDWDPQFIQKTTKSIDMIDDPILFNSCMMKYLFCMFLLIQQILNDDIFNDVISELNKIIKTPILLTDGRPESVLFIISSFYNNTDRSEGLCLSRNLGHNFKKTFDIYLWSGFEDFELDLYMEVRPYLINCPKKAHCEYLCLQNEGNYTVKYDNSTKSLRYYINHQCSSGIFHSFTSWSGIHSCSTELTGVELTYEEHTQKVSIIYDGNRKKNVEEPDTKNDSKIEIKERKKVKARVK
jgi:hypothetical protein